MCEIWAKKPIEDDKSKIITLRQHVSDILNAIKFWLEDRDEVWEKIKEKIKIKKEDFIKLLKYAVFFHDLGKVSPYFQIKRLKNEKFEPKIDFPDIRHNILSLFFINKEKVAQICDYDENLYATFLSAVAFHHWKKDEKDYLLHINDKLIEASRILLDGKGEILAKNLMEHFKGFDFKSLYDEKPEDLISFDENLAKHIKEEGNLISFDIIPPYSLYFLPEILIAKYKKKINLNLWIFLSGLLMRADHFASMVENKEDKKIDLEHIEKKFDEKVDVLEKLKKSKNLTDEQLWQRKILEECKEKNVILVAPTGIGKTEFAFAWAEGEKFFYTLPLRVATNQIFERACEYFNKGEKNPKESEDPYIKGNVGLLHSDADLYLLDKSEISKDSSSDGETLKILDLAKHFSLPVNICTGDQIFPSALKYPGYERIYATLGYSKLIIDEVQAYDPRACAIVVKMIEDIVSLGGKFLLMTATLPEFVKKYLEERGIINDENIKDLYSEEKIVKPDLVRHKIKIENKDIAEDIAEDIETVIKKSQQGKRILVVLNTVDKAEEIYKKIYEKLREKFKGDILLLHSRFTMNERRKREQEIEKLLKNPKPEEEKEPKILVATQVVEASLDIDADYLFTEICPMDSLIQRMGRVMRRVDLITGKVKKTKRDFSYEKYYKNGIPNIFIYCKHKENNKEYKESGKGYVYKNELIERTLQLLSQNGKEMEIKEEDKNKLVKNTYSELENSQYIQQFYKTLDVLNTGYVSENKEEAHNLFREIYTIPVIEGKNTEEIIKKIKNIQEKDISWLWFKKEIIAEFVINENRFKEQNLKSLWEELKEKDIERKVKKRLQKYSQGIWIKIE